MFGWLRWEGELSNDFEVNYEFITRTNIERYQQLLATILDENKRKSISELLQREMQKLPPCGGAVETGPLPSD